MEGAGKREEAQGGVKKTRVRFRLESRTPGLVPQGEGVSSV